LHLKLKVLVIYRLSVISPLPTIFTNQTDERKNRHISFQVRDSVDQKDSVATYRVIALPSDLQCVF